MSSHCIYSSVIIKFIKNINNVIFSLLVKVSEGASFFIGIGIGAGAVWQIIKKSEQKFEYSLEKFEQKTKESIQQVEKSIGEVDQVSEY